LTSLHPGVDGCARLPVNAATTSADFNRRHDVDVASAASKKSPQWASANANAGLTVSQQRLDKTHRGDDVVAADDDDDDDDLVDESSDMDESEGELEHVFV
jgi:hypothetical protein